MTKNFLRKLLIGMTTAASIAAVSTPVSAIEARIEVGTLTCDGEGGSGFILGSSKDMTCSFLGIDNFRENYVGNVKKFGIDIGETERTTITWIVFAPTTELEAGALEGNYAGLSAEASIGAGLGANAMLGGFDQSIALQPFSGQVQQGLNIAAGIGTMTLRNP
ncbi:MAG: DUF992 domain-containing protein [Pseudomonadota bacterium]